MNVVTPVSYTHLEDIKLSLLLTPVEIFGVQSVFNSLFGILHNGGTWFISCILFAYFVYPLNHKLLINLSIKLKTILLIMTDVYKRQVVQCLEDYGIPLRLSCTAAEIHGKERVEGVTLAQVDESGNVVPGTEEYYACDTLLLSVGLIPENELTVGMGAAMDEKTGGPLVSEELETSIPGVFACGNVLHVHGPVSYTHLGVVSSLFAKSSCVRPLASTISLR